jgi:molybdopterin-biosynthesis enzyme MoeA-like protein
MPPLTKSLSVLCGSCHAYHVRRPLGRGLMRLGDCGCAQVSILPDQVAAIAAEVRTLSAAHNVLITTGGVGPTLDDVTMQGVADALGHPLTR